MVKLKEKCLFCGRDLDIEINFKRNENNIKKDEFLLLNKENNKFKC